jgi:hypothetical protein
MDLARLRPFLPAARYAFVILTGLFLFTASSNYLGNAAVQQLQPAAKPAAKPTSVVVRVPDPPVAVKPPAAQPAQKPALPASPETAVAATPAAPPAQAAKPAASPVAVATATEPAAQQDAVVDVSETLEAAALQPAGDGSATHIVVSAVNFRAAPSNGGARLGVLHAGDRVTVLASEGGWMQVEENGVVLGWVYGSFLSSL